MKYCEKCGAENKDGAKFCSFCGEPLAVVFGDNQLMYEEEPVVEDAHFTESEPEESTWNYGSDGQPGYEEGVSGEYFGMEDVSANKLMGVLSYLGILLLIPLFAGNKNSPYLKHHLNQGIGLFVARAIIEGLSRLLKNSFLSWGFGVIGVVLFILTVMGIIYALQGTRKSLPFLDQIQVFH